MEESGEAERRQARRAWKTLGAIVGLLLVGIGILIFHDDDPPDDRWLLPEIKTEAGPKNPLAVFCETIEANPVSGYDVLIKEAKDFQKIVPADMEAFLARHTVQLEAFDRLMETNCDRWRWPGLEGGVDFSSRTPWLTGCQAMATQLERMRIELLVRAGRGEEASREAMRAVRFGYGLASREGLLIEWLVGITCQRVAERSLVSALGLPNVGEETLRRVQEELAPMELRTAQWRRILPWEYLGFKNTLARIKSGSIPSLELLGSDGALMGLLLRPNRTRANYLALQEPVFAAAEQDWVAFRKATRELELRVREWKEKGWRFRISPNAGGNVLVAEGALSIGGLADRPVPLRRCTGRSSR